MTAAARIALLLALLLSAMPAHAFASIPTVAELDAAQRAAGNRLDLAKTAGLAIFGTTWPAQVTQVSVNAFEGHVVIGIRLWGVKFHRPLTRAEFAGEIADLAARAFAAVPKAEEADVWASVPIVVGKDVIVTGDLAKPTTRTVFSLTIRRGESTASIAHRALSGQGAYWDQEWAADAFKKQGT